MKIILALAVLAGTSTALAAETRDIYDIMYLPEAGTTYGFTTGELGKAERDSDELGDLEIDGYSVSQTLGHAFTDRLSLEATLDYDSLKFDPEEGREFDAKGVSDPTVSLRFRTMDEKFRWDVLGGATISFADREVDSDNDRNNLQGGHSLFAGTQFGVKTDIMQWSLAGLLVHNMKATTEFDVNGGPDVEVDDEANNELVLRADLLNKLGNQSYLRSNIQTTFTESYEDDQRPKQETPSSTTFQLGTEYQHVLSRDVLLRGGIDFQRINTLSGQIDDANAWAYRLGVNYQF